MCLLKLADFSNIIMLFLVPPLFVIEFLHRAMDIFEDYFTECNESTIKENYVVVYEVSKAIDKLILEFWCDS